MILVLLSSFSESLDSLHGFKLCQKLAEDGCDVLVTTTTQRGKPVDLEKQMARKMSSELKGSIKLLEPNPYYKEKRCKEWIANNYRQHFDYLAKKTDIELIIGMLPGTTETAVELKDALKCKLVLLATKKFGTSESDLKTQINEYASKAEEVWSFGSDTFDHYENVFKNIDKCKHRTLLLQPCCTNSINKFYWQTSYQPKIPSHGVKTLVSVWNNPVPFCSNDHVIHSSGSSIKDFATFDAAFNEINRGMGQRPRDKLMWNVHGLKNNEVVLNSIKQQVKPNTLQLRDLNSLLSVDYLFRMNCQAFIAPDLVDDSFNWTALTALWLGIPTIVTSQSSIGKFLLQLPCPDETKARAVINLSGDPVSDKEAWIRKIQKEVLNKDENPLKWAREIRKYLHSNTQLWLPNLVDYIYQLDPERALSEISESSYTTALEDLSDNEWKNSEKQFRAYDIEAKNHEKSAASKTVEILKKIESRLSAGNKQLEEIQKRKSSLENEKEETERCFQKTTAESNSHYEKAEEHIRSTKDKQMEILTKKRDTSRLHFKSENEKLNEHLTHCERVVNRCTEFLEKKEWVDFGKQAEEFLSSSELNDLPEEREKMELNFSWEKLEYPEEFRTYVKEHILGIVENGEESNTNQSDYQADSENGEFFRQGTFKGSIQSVNSVAGDSISTDVATLGRSFPSLAVSNTTSQIGLPVDQNLVSEQTNILSLNNTFAELVSTVNIKTFEGSHLKTFLNAVFRDKLLWIFGWNRKKFGLNKLGMNFLVILNVQIPSYKTLLKEKKKDALANQAMLTASFGNVILFAGKGRPELCRFDTTTLHFKRVYTCSGNIAAICCGDSRVYVLNCKQPDFITVLNSKYTPTERIPTGLEKWAKCDFSMCMISDTSDDNETRSEARRRNYSISGSVPNQDAIVITASAPLASIRAVSKSQGIIWKLDSSTNDTLDSKFDPSDVSASWDKIIFIDRGRGKIFTLSVDGKNLQAILGTENGIQSPTIAHIDKEGRKVVVIDKNGSEIRNYKLSSRMHVNKPTSSEIVGAADLQGNFSRTDSESARKKESLDFPVLASSKNGNRSSSTQKTSNTDGVGNTFGIAGGKDDGFTDTKLLTLCDKLHSPRQLRRLACNGLGIERYKVDGPLEKHRHAVVDATYDVLNEWLLDQPDRLTAKVNLMKALKDANMVNLRDVIQ